MARVTCDRNHICGIFFVQIEQFSYVSFFQNSVSFGKSFRKTNFLAGFPHKFKVPFPKTGVLEKTQVIYPGLAR